MNCKVHKVFAKFTKKKIMDIKKPFAETNGCCFLALMEVASFSCLVSSHKTRRDKKRYNGQQEIAPNTETSSA
ncbi:hypothetical protein IWX84_000038 [Flavobacterium sp. CG_9.10]|uniref:hypothetical protein n=1 Tax=Flavobacterium sp. CG_9.10 TaxID=2787729 RepID=UPI0018CBCA59|nr:hypothetical protein [Flavobacterium sp. CG_9.10]MBG6109183.1 hypothetical protein [Flavobacterium sp. CG_9.10]